ncbi:MAG TPA: tyrosine-type recombinase/integrase [Verrucomicrobiae bacterium]|nr:tyrosine-type recombinase/integrase [Verrucomicrobiae bacterium]
MRRRETSGVYYAFIKRGRKQIRRSLKTTDKALARRKLADLLREVDRLVSAEAAHATFSDVASRWIETTRHALKPGTVRHRQTCLKALSPFFAGQTIRNLTLRHCEAWLTERGQIKAPQTLIHELNVMRAVFKYAEEQGLILRDPSKSIKRPRHVTKTPTVPTREQFQNIVAAIRGESQGKGNEGADLIELLAYSGMRLNEACSLRWRDVNFTQGLFRVTGGERGTKNREQRTVPVSDELRALLIRLKRDRETVAPDAFIAQNATARKCLETACRNLGLPKFHHHSLRHFFATCAIESGVDIPTVARWLGHKDGGALLMKTYSHLQPAHSLEQIKRVSFGTEKRVLPL